MMCKCGFDNNETAKFCSECGLSLAIKKKSFKIPQMLTVRESHELIFGKKLSLTKIYELVKKKSLPHVNAGGKILLDVEKTLLWWENMLNKSVEPNKKSGLRKII